MCLKPDDQPLPVRALAQMITHTLTAMRLALGGGFSKAFAGELLVLTLFSVILLRTSLVFFSWTLRRARQFGTLSFY